LGKFASLFQTEIYATLQCAYENIRTYKDKGIPIFSDSQSALKALSGLKVISRLVAECQDTLFELANFNDVNLIWVSGIMTSLAMKKLISLPDKRQLHRHSVQSRLLEYLGV
jgi:hypothetical protein